MIEIVTAIVLAVLAAMLYALVGYLDGMAEHNEEFDVAKFAATSIIGVFVGVVLYTQGVEVTATSVAQLMLVYAGLTAVVYKIVKAVLAKLNLLPACLAPKPD